MVGNGHRSLENSLDKQYLSRLTKAERDEWDDLRLMVTQIGARRRRYLIIWGTIMAVIGAVALLGMGISMATSSDGGANALPWIIALNVALFTYLFGNFVPIIIGSGDQRAARTRIEELVQVAKTRRSTMNWGDDNSSPYKSKRQMQHEWYEGHSELNWRDRETAEMYGVDVETYISNVLENDRD